MTKNFRDATETEDIEKEQVGKLQAQIEVEMERVGCLDLDIAKEQDRHRRGA